ncbi:hypothetical protein NA78x_001649 [Anatilimnocola sp. NA78]|uniref:hypothetical protein n=1 Tax=Anatilimnocola sp. NA78 TaxID=3415683 RepID=UPI003CE4E2C2
MHRYYTLALIAATTVFCLSGDAQEPRLGERQPPPSRAADGDKEGDKEPAGPRGKGFEPPPRRGEDRGPGGPGGGPPSSGPSGPRFGPGSGNPPPPPRDGGPGPGGPFRGPPGHGPGGPGPGMGGPGYGGPHADWQRLEQLDPEMYALMKSDSELEEKSLEISKQIRQLPRDQRVKLKEELTTVLNEHFDVRQKRRALQVKRMEEDLKKLREAVTKRNEAREGIVRKRLGELTGEESDQDF